MNLIMNDDADECISLLINSVPVCHFEKFIKCISSKEDWTSELCWCSFEKSVDNTECYIFETFEDDTYTMPYEEFLKIVKLAIIRFYIGTDDVKNKEMLERAVKNTVFDSAFDNIDLLCCSAIRFLLYKRH